MTLLEMSWVEIESVLIVKGFLFIRSCSPCRVYVLCGDASCLELWLWHRQESDGGLF